MQVLHNVKMPAASWTKSRSQNNTQIDKPKQQQDQADECSEELLPQVQLQVRPQKAKNAAQNATTVQFNSFEKFWGKCCASESKERKDYNKNGISKKPWKGE